MRVAYSTGVISQSESHAVVLPVSFTAGTTYRLLIGLHGAGSTAGLEIGILGGKSNYTLRAMAFSQAGFYQLWINGNGGDWANDTAQAALTAAWNWAKLNLPVKTDGFVTYGNSAGNSWGLIWAKDNPGILLAHAGSLPAVDIQDIHDNNRQSLAASIEIAAIGSAGSIPDSWYAAHSPIRNQAALSSLAQRYWYSDTDTVALPALSTNYTTAVGASLVNIGNQGHSISGSTPYGVLPLQDVANWLSTYK